LICNQVCSNILIKKSKTKGETMKKSGFTMIELIFVIVIIGILAAVAVPKLAATRTDAKISAISQEVQSAVSEVANYVTAQGGKANDKKLTEMSQVLKQAVDQGKAEENSNGDQVDLYGDDTTPCVTLKTDETTLTVSTNANADGQVCKGVKDIVKDAEYQVAGSSVKR
jgi:prepilin-type N-terminal cleavage/methylation domain-containing protein